MNGTRIQARQQTPLHAHDCLGITSEGARGLDLNKALGYLRLLGSIATEVVYAAQGRLYACISLGDKLVDMGAAACIAREAGCEMNYLSGDAFRLGDWMEAPPRPEPLFIGPDWAVRELRERLGS
jgi:fructose-1,6-bisphosphatase/inositol monophosphatase family enzyme